MTQADTLLQHVLTHTRLPTPPFPGPQEGLIVDADPGSGTCRFTIPAFNRQVAFGPAPYPRPAVAPTSLSTIDGISPDPHGHVPSVPPAGTRCLVVFAGPDSHGDYSPWVVAFTGWPAMTKATSVMQSGSSAFASASSFTITMPSNPTAGNRLRLAVGTWGTSADYVSSVTSTGDTWALVKKNAYGSGGVEQWEARNIAGGSGDKVITVTLTASTVGGGGVCHEVSGMPAIATLDQFAVANSRTTGTITPTANGEILFAACFDYKPMTSPGGLWNDPSGVINCGGNLYLDFVYEVQTTATAAAAAFGSAAGAPNAVITSDFTS